MTPAQTEARKALDRYKRAIEARIAASRVSRVDLRDHQRRVETADEETRARVALETAFDLAVSALDSGPRCSCGIPARPDCAWCDACLRAGHP